MTQRKIFCKGNVVVNQINVNDIHYEFGYGSGIKLKVIEAPERDENRIWRWKSQIIGVSLARIDSKPEYFEGGKIIDYAVNEDYQHYGANLYNSDEYGMFENKRVFSKGGKS